MLPEFLKKAEVEVGDGAVAIAEVRYDHQQEPEAVILKVNSRVRLDGAYVRPDLNKDNYHLVEPAWDRVHQGLADGTLDPDVSSNLHFHNVITQMLKEFNASKPAVQTPRMEDILNKSVVGSQTPVPESHSVQELEAASKAAAAAMSRGVFNSGTPQPVSMGVIRRKAATAGGASGGSRDSEPATPVHIRIETEELDLEFLSHHQIGLRDSLDNPYVVVLVVDEKLSVLSEELIEELGKLESKYGLRMSESYDDLSSAVLLRCAGPSLLYRFQDRLHIVLPLS